MGLSLVGTVVKKPNGFSRDGKSIENLNAEALTLEELVSSRIPDKYVSFYNSRVCVCQKKIHYGISNTTFTYN